MAKHDHTCILFNGACKGNLVGFYHLVSWQLECLPSQRLHKQWCWRLALTLESPCQMFKAPNVLINLLHQESTIVSLQVCLLSDKKLKRQQCLKYKNLQGKLFKYWEDFIAGEIKTRHLLHVVHIWMALPADNTVLPEFLRDVLEGWARVCCVHILLV